MIPGFKDAVWQGPEGAIAYSAAGRGEPILLLHGFPQNRAMWAEIAPRLVQAGFCVVAPDLRGYGASHKPLELEDYSFRAMGRDMAGLMSDLGHSAYHLVGHDRGARTAHRMALDDRMGQIASLTLMDIIPTHLLLDQLSRHVAKAYYHWFFLAQPAPFPETMIGHDPDAYFESCLLGWGAARIEDFAPEQMAAYRAAWRDPETIRGMCADYRAALEIDFQLDSKDLKRKVDVSSLVLWGADGAMGKAYDVASTWADRLSKMDAKGIPGGHFFPDTAPEETAKALVEFIRSTPLHPVSTR
jgi:haloacetate dehalogenase